MPHESHPSPKGAGGIRRKRAEGQGAPGLVRMKRGKRFNRAKWGSSCPHFDLPVGSKCNVWLRA